MGLREFINRKPWLGWALAGVMLLLAVYMYIRLSGRTSPDSVARLSQTVTIKCVETGDEWEMNRGLMELELMRRSGRGELTAKDGLVNPKTGRPTGFPFNKSEWEETIERINRERAAQELPAAPRGGPPPQP